MGRAGGITGAGLEEPLGQAGRAYQNALPDRPIALPAQEPLGQVIGNSPSTFLTKSQVHCQLDTTNHEW